MNIIPRCFIFLILFAGNPASAQTQAPKIQSDELFANKQYCQALPLLLTRIKSDPTNGNLFYKAGMCYLHSRSQKGKAESFLEKAIELSTSFYTHGYAKDSDAPLDVYYHLGLAYAENYKFDAAIKSFEKYREVSRTSKVNKPVELTKVDDAIAHAKFCREMKASTGIPSSLKSGFVKYGESCGDFSCTLSADKSTMVYTLKVPVAKAKKYEDDRYFEEHPLAGRQKPDTIITKNVVKKNKSKVEQDTIVNITTIGTSVDGQVVLTYRNEGGEAHLYLSRLKANKWTSPVKLPKTVNDKGWEPGEFMSADGKELYFTSDRPGGFGGKDIYKCVRRPDGDWDRAVNLGPEINTPYDEVAPFLHPDGETLYYSSNRNRPLVTYDIFSSNISTSGKWSKAMVVGYPVNSSDDNIFYQVAGDKKKLYAGKTGSPVNAKATGPSAPDATETESKNKRKKEKAGNPDKFASDNYIITFENNKRSPLTLIKGEVKTGEEKTTRSLAARIIVIDNDSEKIHGVFYSEPGTGQYLFILPQGKNNGIIYEADGYLFQSENLLIKDNSNFFETHQRIYMPALEEGAKTSLRNVFFETDKTTLRAASFAELNRVVQLMTNYPDIKIRLSNCIYSEDGVYKKISQERADAVKNHLVGKGIDPKRIKTQGKRKTPEKNKNALAPAVDKNIEPTQELVLEVYHMKKQKEK